MLSPSFRLYYNFHLYSVLQLIADLWCMWVGVLRYVPPPHRSPAATLLYGFGLRFC